MKNLVTVSETNMSKKDIVSLAQSEAKAIVEAADINLLPLLIQASRSAEYLNSFIGEIKKAATEEALNYNEKSVKIQGAKVEIREVGVKYDYSNCPIWSKIQSNVKEVEAARKEREEMLKALKTGFTQLDEETGETIQVFPPTKSSSTSLVITL